MNYNDEMSRNVNQKTKAVKPHGAGQRAWVLLSCMLLILVLAASVSYLWLRSQHSTEVRSLRTASHPAFEPVVGDVNDPEQDDPDITVQQALVPGFQFKQGGYT